MCARNCGFCKQGYQTAIFSLFLALSEPLKLIIHQKCEAQVQHLGSDMHLCLPTHIWHFVKATISGTHSIYCRHKIIDTPSPLGRDVIYGWTRNACNTCNCIISEVTHPNFFSRITDMTSHIKNNANGYVRTNKRSSGVNPIKKDKINPQFSESYYFNFEMKL